MSSVFVDELQASEDGTKVFFQSEDAITLR